MGQLGTIGLETQNYGTVKVPVFNPADFGSNVHDMVRVQTAGGVGAIPFVAPSDAKYPYLRIQTQNHGVLAANDKATLLTLIDDFEDVDMSEYNGDTVEFDMDTAKAYHGSTSLYSDTAGTITSTSGLDNYPVAGDTFKFYTWHDGADADAAMKFYFGLQDTNNCYYVYVTDDAFSTTVGLEGISGGSSLVADTASHELDRDQWLEWEITWQTDGDIFANLYDASGNRDVALNVNDTTYTSGGIGWQNGGHRMWYDFCYIP